ncbi:YhgE/Pip domain-containing protein [Streptomyces sp. BHT-5-2]|uniref:YhgE/Pip domain-containing protein n=1 Tax=Streptomyces sp. BHT-5-2 TaxID=2866715 RepID=UPI001C8D0333|nr:YhgE/Pip domain-containing protein [Streptomyces sp. BHT-5-2]QZL06218.1 YhgE/Pip domain-containing protein [Streptomyces sp. BHT-5-2]
MRSPKLAALELKRFGRGKLPRAALAALLLLPLLYGALYLCSFWDPYSRLDRIPVALVDEDRGADVGGQHLSAGAGIVAGLRDSHTFDWHQVDAEEAGRGVEDGTYFLSLSIPRDFSRRLASSSGDHPETGALKVRTNDANNYIVGQISRTVFSEVRAAASAKASRTFLDKIFVSFSTLHGKTEQAADGADRLKDGIGQAEDGAGRLADGLGTAKNGSARLAGGLGDLDAGAGRLSRGGADLAKGAGVAAEGSRQLADGSGQVAQGTQQLADTVNGVVGKVGPFVRAHGKEIGEAARLVADGAQAVRDHLDKLPAAASTGARLSRGISDHLAAYYRLRCGTGLDLAADCAELKQLTEQADAAAGTAEEVSGYVHDQKNLDRLGRDLDTLHSLASELAAHGPTLGADMDAAVRKINDLNEGAHEVSAGARQLAAGNAQLAAGADRLGTGARQLHDGTGRAAAGMTDLDAGVGRLKDGARTLDGGMFKLSDGSAQLAGGLHDGARQIPDYDRQDRDARTLVMSDPVQLASGSAHKAPNYGTGFAPYFIPLSLWVGAMVAYMLIPPLNRRALAMGAPSWRVALSGWLPVFGIGVLQTAALMAVLHFALGLQMARAAGTIGFLILVTGCFSALVQWLNAKFGPAGRILVLALLMLQLTSAGGTYPVQTSPGFFGAVHPFLPMSYVVEGLRRLITGGDLAPVWQGGAVLLAFTLGGLALTALAARGRQVVRMKDLHPELSL